MDEETEWKKSIYVQIEMPGKFFKQ